MRKVFIYLSLIILSMIGSCVAGCENHFATTQLKDQLKSDSIVAEPLTPLNVIPMWVKEKVTSEEYGMLEKISTRFLVDYSFLRKDISAKRRQEIALHMKTLCKMIEDGIISEDSPWVWSVASERHSISKNSRLERLYSEEMDENEEPRSQALIVYTAAKDDEVYLQATVSYTYNRETKVASDVKVSFTAMSSIPARRPTFSGSGNADYNSGSKNIQGSCAGTLSYYDSNTHIENEMFQNKQFVVTP